MIEKFFEFLKENKAYDKYVECTAKHSGLHSSCVEDFIIEELKKAPVRDYVSCMFFWDETEEGLDYWFYLHSKWTYTL